MYRNAAFTLSSTWPKEMSASTTDVLKIGNYCQAKHKLDADGENVCGVNFFAGAC